MKHRPFRQAAWPGTILLVLHLLVPAAGQPVPVPVEGFFPAVPIPPNPAPEIKPVPEPSDTLRDGTFHIRSTRGDQLQVKFAKPTVPFETIAGTLSIPREKIVGLRWNEGKTTLRFQDSSSISGTFAGKSLAVETTIGPVEFPIDLIASLAAEPSPTEKQGGSLKRPKSGLQGSNENPDLFPYVVLKGDTLAIITKTFITTEQALQRVNPGLKPNTLRPGMKILIPPLE